MEGLATAIVLIFGVFGFICMLAKPAEGESDERWKGLLPCAIAIGLGGIIIALSA